MKGKFNKNMESLKKQNQTETFEIQSFLSQIKNALESHYSRLEQAEDRNSGLKDKRILK
jgi:hypothetical protein